MSDIVSIALRVLINCIVFLFFLFVPFKKRFRYSFFKTALFALMLIALTEIMTILFFTSNQFYVNYSYYGIILWFIIALIIFSIAIKNSFFEILFIVLMVVNIYVNITAISTALLSVLDLDFPIEIGRTFVGTIVLILFLPLLWFLMIKLYQELIEFNINFSFWRFIWVIPAMIYSVFILKIVGIYWTNPTQVGFSDLIFIIFWSLISYAFFCVTLQMLIQTYKGLAAIEETHLISLQLNMQMTQYEKMLDNIESMLQLKHDWHHHLLSIKSFSDNDDKQRLQAYLKELMTIYLPDVGIPLCEHHVIDSILRYNLEIAKSLDICTDISVDILKSIPLKDTALCILFGNLVENAVEACKKQDSDEDKRIKIRAEMKEKQLILSIKNTYNGKLIFKDDLYYSTKHEGVGIGLSSVKRVVEKNHGIMRVIADEHCFKVEAILNLS